jgi:ribosomal protein L40E
MSSLPVFRFLHSIISPGDGRLSPNAYFFFYPVYLRDPVRSRICKNNIPPAHIHPLNLFLIFQNSYLKRFSSASVSLRRIKMKCSQCGVENPKQSKFCRKCGTTLGVRLPCAQCGFENPGDSIFCTECGERLAGSQKSVEGTQRKCRNCGHFNELDTLFCISCGEEMIKAPKENRKRSSDVPSYKAIALLIGLVLLLGLFVKLGISLFKEERSSKLSSSPAAISTSVRNVDEAKVIAVAKNFKCACGGCGELPLETCTCDMPKGAVEEKNFVREKLAEGFTVEQVVELLDKKYGHRV